MDFRFILIMCGLVLFVFFYLLTDLLLFKYQKYQKKRSWQNRINESLRILDDLNKQTEQELETKNQEKLDILDQLKSKDKTVFGCVFKNLGGQPK